MPYGTYPEKSQKITVLGRIVEEAFYPNNSNNNYQLVFEDVSTPTITEVNATEFFREGETLFIKGENYPNSNIKMELALVDDGKEKWSQEFD